jgi:hypothetical protein
MSGVFEVAQWWLKWVFAQVKPGARRRNAGTVETPDSPVLT